jgi:hypothetical protein
MEGHGIHSILYNAKNHPSVTAAPTTFLTLPAACCRYPNKQQQELFFRHYMAEDAVLAAAAQPPLAQPPQPPLMPPLQLPQHVGAAAAQQDTPKGGGPFAWLRRLRLRHKQPQQQPAQQQQQQQQQQQVHRFGSMEVCSSSASSGELPPLPADVVDRLSASANVWALASHLYWGIWAIIQVRGAPLAGTIMVPFVQVLCLVRQSNKLQDIISSMALDVPCPSCSVRH